MAKKSTRKFQAENWSTESFLNHFMRVHEQMPERAFAFVLGAGASKSCGIVTGGELVDKWLAELKERDPNRKGMPTKKWATASRLDIDDFTYDRRAEFYPQIYDRRFRHDLEEGYAYLEDVMKDAEPGLGYSMLAQILTDSRHKVVITTNFDNLVADAVLLYTDTFAQVCGHESLTAFVRTEPRRPLVAKIHRDLLLGPQNDPTETALLHEDWQRTLRQFFIRYTPIFVGYGGNDGSLMNFLSSLKPGTIPGTMFWCYREADGEPGDRIQRLLVRHTGKLVPILDFDTFMCQIAEPLGYGLLDRQVEERSRKRANDLRDQWKMIKKAADRESQPPAATERARDASALAREALDKVETRRVGTQADWWSWVLKARREPDLDKRDQIYSKGGKQFPNSPDLLGSYAVFKFLDRGDYAAATGLLQKALKLDPEHTVNMRNYALTLQHLGNDDEAGRLYRKAIELSPNDSASIGNYAVFLYERRKDDESAEKMYRRALDLDPTHVLNLANYTELLLVSDRMSEARSMSDRAWTLASAAPVEATTGLCLIRGIIQRLDDKDDTAALGRLKTLFDAGFFWRTWSGDNLFSRLDRRLSADDRKLYHAISNAIPDKDKVGALDEFPRWKNVEPIPLYEPWPPLAEQD